MPFIDINALTGKSTAAQPDPSTTPSDTSTPVPTTAPVSDTQAVVAQPIDMIPAGAAVVTPPTEVIPNPTAHEAVEVQTPVITFASTPDAEDPDKAANVPMPEVVVTPGTHVIQNGLREVKGPEFQQPQPTNDAVKALEDVDMTKKLAELATQATPLSESVPGEIPPVDSAVGVLSEVPVEVPAEMEPEPVVAEVSAALSEPTPVEPAADTLQVEVSPVAELEMAPVETPIPEIAPDPVVPTPEIMPAPVPTSLPEMPPVAEMTAQASAPSGELMASGELSMERLIAETLAAKASDLHISPGYRVMIRVDGKLQELRTPVLSPADTERLLSGLPKEKVNMEELLDSDFAYQSGNGTRFRVNLFRQRNGIAAALRVVATNIPSLASLNLSQKVSDFVQVSQGLILVTGPTGSGKSTTIASIVNEINREQPKHIVTIEDPIEYVYPPAKSLVDQRNIGEDTETWAAALRAVLRQDPDVVVVGEMRDLETIAAAITTAETGHLVFGTLHTNSAAQSIDRIIDVFPAGQQQQIRTQLANVLVGVVSQRLIPVNGGGRRAAQEIMLANSAVKTAIRDGKIHQIDNIIQTSADIGMVAMERSLVELVRKGMISVEVAQYYSNKPDEVLRLLGANNR